MENEEQELAEGEELRPITKCFSSLEVSTNATDAYRSVTCVITDQADHEYC
jgi:hypothetical protein